MATYFIDKIQNQSLKFVAGSINELEGIAIHFAANHGGHIDRIYVHCSHVCSSSRDEQNVEYQVRVNNQKRTITTKRI